MTDQKLTGDFPTEPTVTDILIAVARVNAGDWFDPYDDDPLRCRPLYWACDIYGPSGGRAGDGCGRSAGEALAMAWIMVWALDAIGARSIEIGEVPLEIPAGWRFELTPPWRAKRTMCV
jgi:hypothetical protein